jgi:Flp pilus assembly protein TadG
MATALANVKGRSRRGGAAAAELALTLPFLALMFGAALDFCRVFCVTQTVQNCAWVGALYASGTATNPSAASPAEAARQAAVLEGASLYPALDPAKVSTVYQGTTATVTVQYQFQALTPLVGIWGNVTVTRSASMAMAPT